MFHLSLVGKFCLCSCDRDPEFHPMRGEGAVYTCTRARSYLLSWTPVQCYPPFWQQHSDLSNFSDGTCHVVKITRAEGNFGMGVFGPDIVARISN